MIYLDNAATTQIMSPVLDEMKDTLTGAYGNPAGVYDIARTAHAGLELARSRVAALINASPREIYFTGCGTESNNWALKGVAFNYKNKGRHIITSATEHSAVLKTCAWLSKNGFQVTYLQPDRFGIIHRNALARALRQGTILVSIMHVNNEVGALNDIPALCAVVKKSGALFHTDAVQAVGHIPVSMRDSGVDLLSLSGHKFYAPKGVGALYIRDGVKIDSLLHGGSQERSIRGGTHNMPGIVGMGMAAKLCASELQDEANRLWTLNAHLRARLALIDGCIVNSHPSQCAPGILNITLPGVKSEKMLMRLDMAGIACSAGSACSAGAHEPSHVLISMGVSRELAKCSLRISFGRYNTLRDMDAVADELGRLSKNRDAVNPFSQFTEPKIFV